MKPEVLIPHFQRLNSYPYPALIHPIHNISTCYFKLHRNSVLPTAILHRVSNLKLLIRKSFYFSNLQNISSTNSSTPVGAKHKRSTNLSSNLQMSAEKIWSRPKLFLFWLKIKLPKQEFQMPCKASARRKTPSLQLRNLFNVSAKCFAHRFGL